MSTRIHPTAVIHDGAQLDDNVEVGPYCVVNSGVRIGAGTVLHNHVTVEGPCTIGRENEVFPYAVLGAEPQDKKFQGLDTELVIGDRNKIREHVTIHRGTEMGGLKTAIGSDCLIMVGVHIAHDCAVEDEAIIANNCMLGGHCRIERAATLAGGVGVHHFTTIGTLAFVGGMSRITKDVPPYVVVEGVPAEVRKLNRTALVRRKWSGDLIRELDDAFRLIFRNPDVSALSAADQLRAASASQPVLNLCTFIERTQLGVYGRQLEADRNARS